MDHDKVWKGVSDEVAALRCVNGSPVDPLIAPTVIALRALGFATDGSCEGHFDRIPYPYVSVETPGHREFDSPDEQFAWMDQNYPQLRRIIDLLSEFYRDRRSPYDVQICPLPSIDWGAFQLQSVGGEASRVRDAQSRQAHLRLYQAEMAAFGEFLRTWFFSHSLDEVASLFHYPDGVSARNVWSGEDVYLDVNPDASSQPSEA